MYIHGHIPVFPCPGMVERNEARSQKMVAEELGRIVQSELVEMRQRNVAETTGRVRLENQLGELKVYTVALIQFIYMQDH